MNIRELAERLTGVFTPPQVVRTRDWVQSEYSAYPRGVVAFKKDDETEEVSVILSEPVHLKTLSVLAEQEGFRTTVSHGGDESYLSIYDVQDVGGGRSRHQLIATFTTNKVQTLGLDPVTDYRIDKRIVLLSRYLGVRYVESEVED